MFLTANGVSLLGGAPPPKASVGVSGFSPSPLNRGRSCQFLPSVLPPSVRRVFKLRANFGRARDLFSRLERVGRRKKAKSPRRRFRDRSAGIPTIPQPGTATGVRAPVDRLPGMAEKGAARAARASLSMWVCRLRPALEVLEKGVILGSYRESLSDFAATWQSHLPVLAHLLRYLLETQGQEASKPSRAQRGPAMALVTE